MLAREMSGLDDTREAKPTQAELAVLRSLFEREFSYVWNTLRRLGVRSMDLDDVTHDTFLKVQRGLHDYDPSRPIRPWLFGVAFRVASDYRRLARHRCVVEERDDPLDPAPGPEEHCITRQSLSLVATALQSLSIDRRAVFILHVIDACPMPEVAQTLQIPLNTAYSRLRLAREDFVAAMRRQESRRRQP